MYAATESINQHAIVLRKHPFAQDAGVFRVQAGQTLEAMLREGAQGAELSETLQVQVGGIVVPRHLWARVRPKAGTSIHVTAVPRRNSGLLQAVLLVVVAVVAWYAAPLLAGSTAGFVIGGTAAQWATGLYLVGALCVPARIEVAR